MEDEFGRARTNTVTRTSKSPLPCLDCGKLSKNSRCYDCTRKRRFQRYGNDEYKLSHKIALERDGYRCAECGATKNLETHHITPLRDGGSHDPRNLITLCNPCHVLAESATLGQ